MPTLLEMHQYGLLTMDEALEADKYANNHPGWFLLLPLPLMEKVAQALVLLAVDHKRMSMH